MRFDPARPSLSRSAPALGAILGLVAAATAQVPVGWAVCSRFQGGGPTAAPGGLSVVDLAAPGIATSISGLSTELQGSSAAAGAPEGAASVLVDGRTGHLVVGEHALPGDFTDIHLVTLNGLAVANDVRYTLGTAPGGGGWVDQMAWLGDDVVFTVRGDLFTSGVMMGHLLGVLRPSVGGPGTPGAITPVPFTSLPVGYMNALAVDQERGIAYFGMWQSQTSSDIYSVPVPGDGVTPVAPALVATLPSGVLNLTLQGDGMLVAGCVGTAGKCFHIDVSQSPATVTQVAIGVNDINGITVENTTGDFILCDSGARTIYRWRPGAFITTIGVVNGGASGVAVRQSVATFGRSSPGQNHYEWVLAPNPGGAPSLGNAGFAMTIASTPGTAVGFAGLSLGEATVPTPYLGANILLDTATLVVPTVLVPAAQSTIPLPIPSGMAWVGLQIYAQTMHLESTGVAASCGLRVTIMP